MRRSSVGWLALCALVSVLQAAQPASPAPEWAAQKGAGFSVETPAGWSVWPDARKGWVHLMGTQGEDVVVWPVFLPGVVSVPDLKTVQAIHQKLAAACPFQAQWESAQAAGPNLVRARGKSGEMTAVSAFAWKPSPRGVAGYFYSAAARKADFAGKAADLVRVLGSFRLTGDAGGAGGVQWALFADPMEGAFTAEVPAGWQASGGLIRSSPEDPHLVLGVTSPDGRTRVSLGDPQMSTYFIDPAGSLIPEGSMNGAAMVLRYLTGAYFCQFYVASRAPMFCTDLQISEVRDNPEMVPYVLSKDPTLAQRPFSIGSAAFQCREQGQMKAGFCQALTTRLSLPAPGQIGMWNLKALTVYLTPPDRAEQTRAIMTHIGDSVRFNPQWGMQEVRNAGVRSGIISGTANQIAGMGEATQRKVDAVEERIARMRSDATLGIVRLEDPATGRQTTVDSGANFYWVDPRGVIVGTNVDTTPGVDFRRMIESPAP
ncbi:MAG: hypothetical protein IT158_21865 [Bryobacterales bacterium]|nr:hypothetical protein [Bryobacterales bacterium]